MKKRYMIDAEQILCPFCVNHIFGRWLVNAQLPSDQVIIPIEISSHDPRTKALKNFYGGEMIVPTSVVFEETVFMNRKVLKSKFISVGAYDDYATYRFKKQIMNVTEV